MKQFVAFAKKTNLANTDLFAQNVSLNSKPTLTRRTSELRSWREQRASEQQEGINGAERQVKDECNNKKRNR